MNKNTVKMLNKKLVTTLLAFAMVLTFTFACTGAVFAEDYPNITNAPGTEYTTKIESTTNAKLLEVIRASADYQNKSPFPTSAEARKVKWTFPNGGGNNFIVKKEVNGAADSWYAGLSVRKMPLISNKGAYTVRATKGSANMDLTLVIPESKPKASKGVKISVDGTNTEGDPDTFNNVTKKTGIKAPAGEYNYATPMTALTAMKSDTPSATRIKDHDGGQTGYVSSITGYQNGTTAVTKSASSDYTRGWNYRVYRIKLGRYVLDPSSAYIGASAVKVSNGDAVLWYYGSYSEATEYYNDMTSAKIKALFK
ncbi:hypothetical protein AXF21_06070 [Eubacterium minutum ATCC 700079]|nr:hypothetical protein AXF21_06070 [Eubacterium minutum ATCC 700079]